MSGSRRIFLKQVAAAPFGVALAGVSADVAAQAQAPAGYTSLGPEEAAFVEMLVNVMCPADNLTTNGVDCGLATFIDRQVAGDFGRGDRLYRSGPFRRGKAGSLAGFTYSRAMRNSSVLWDEKSLDAFIAEPQKAIPGNTMPFGGISDPKQRAEIVDYLKTLK
jgi:hypothetical protein